VGVLRFDGISNPSWLGSCFMAWHVGLGSEMGDETGNGSRYMFGGAEQRKRGKGGVREELHGR
jgi:hypothetical protein